MKNKYYCGKCEHIGMYTGSYTHSEKLCKRYAAILKVDGNDVEKCVPCICETLEAENAALRERLDKSVELPPGNRVWFITEDEEGEESYVISKPTGCLTVNELYEIGKKYFTTCEAAKKAVEELKRRDKNG